MIRVEKLPVVDEPAGIEFPKKAELIGPCGPFPA
jgi:hypothetical protein